MGGRGVGAYLTRSARLRGCKGCLASHGTWSTRVGRLRLVCFSRGWDGFCCGCGSDDLEVATWSLSLRVGSEVDSARREERAGTEARRGSPSLNGLTVDFMSALSRRAGCRGSRREEEVGRVTKQETGHILRCRVWKEADQRRQGALELRFVIRDNPAIKFNLPYRKRRFQHTQALEPRGISHIQFEIRREELGPRHLLGLFRG